MLNQILLGDCYELMKGIPDGSIDLVLTDPPYNTTDCDWDKNPIDLVELWDYVKRILKPKGAVVMTGSQPFTTDLICSNRAWFRYELVWKKSLPTGHLNARKFPLKAHENILVFSPVRGTYNPILRKNRKIGGKKRAATELFSNFNLKAERTLDLDKGYPLSILEFSSVYHTREGLQHPTQKPIALFEYLIRTYSNPGETILDPFAGSGTTALAAHATGRNFICFEKEAKYWEIANKRLALAQMQGRFEEMVG
jgi:site-specific DNA-methyltransferase (adenine-specific)